MADRKSGVPEHVRRRFPGLVDRVPQHILDRLGPRELTARLEHVAALERTASRMGTPYDASPYFDLAQRHLEALPHAELSRQVEHLRRTAARAAPADAAAIEGVIAELHEQHPMPPGLSDLTGLPRSTQPGTDAVEGIGYRQPAWTQGTTKAARGAVNKVFNIDSSKSWGVATGKSANTAWYQLENRRLDHLEAAERHKRTAEALGGEDAVEFRKLAAAERAKAAAIESEQSKKGKGNR
ncbi:hypothetical protein ABZ468_42925 [Streptomyces sp. NPDC005708]|uniref:hypothetical protein n=1 Tax=Streptomyces sp. NPDC005708 TaxID=3154564 RepID=UPI003404BFD7